MPASLALAPALVPALVPALDPSPIPGPAWLFHVLWVATFVIHLLFVNAVLGGTLLAAAASFAGKRLRPLAVLFVEMNSWTISLAITFGIAPLLFLQVLHGRFFYSSTILVARGWLGMLVLLTVAYYLNYVVKARLRSGGDAPALLAVEAFLFLAIAAIQVAVHLLSVQPSLWEAASRSGFVILSDPSFAPRFLHFVLAAISLAGALAIRQGIRAAEAGKDRADADAMARFGQKAAFFATFLQMADGVWLLLALPRPVLRGLMRGGAATMGPLMLAILLGLGLLVLLAQLSDPLAAPKKARHVTELILGAILLMVVTRHQVRGLYLAVSGVSGQPAEAPQWGMFLAFLAVFVACIALTVFACARAWKDRPAGPGETA
jgi:hypothetical protein